MTVTAGQVVGSEDLDCGQVQVRTMDFETDGGDSAQVGPGEDTPLVVDADGSTLTELTDSDVHQLVEDGVISEGMLPKVQCALDAINAGVASAQIIDGTLAHSLLLEIFTDSGIGTKITHG